MIKQIPVIDLFAGPGGLGEGFSSLYELSGKPIFNIKVSIEKDALAHKTLSLRAAYRHLKQVGVPDSYYDYIKGKINREILESLPEIKEAMSLAYVEARQATLGEIDNRKVDQWIFSALQGEKDWVLIGGPPCQAYSLVGRSRMRSKDPCAFEKDHRHFLYKEYLRIIKDHKPAIFVMENVKGILSSTYSGGLIFEQIIKDLALPSEDVGYELRSFVVKSKQEENISAKDFLIRSEHYGIPQARHRVILLGVRKDWSNRQSTILERIAAPTVFQVIDGLPKLRSRISRQPDSYENWYNYLKVTINTLHYWHNDSKKELLTIIEKTIENSKYQLPIGNDFIAGNPDNACMPDYLRQWLEDKRLGGVIQHVSRGHMPTDLQRYLFAASYAQKFSISPKIKQFPRVLLPKHKNVTDENVPFDDRFRVQLKDFPSTTIVSHISKDGHYYIHYDPQQCRSLTVREAARLQTFPDNYFFEGNRTHQYVQVGNAVPPLLAKKLAEVVAQLFDRKFI